MQKDNVISIPKNETVEITLSHNNWEAEFPYKPQVSAALSHDSQTLFLNFVVKEKAVLARVSEDNGEVWTDSCVEFFISFDDSGYYNFEFSCIGKLLLAFRKEKPAPEYASIEIMNSIVRKSSLGNEPFEERVNENGEDFEWEMAVEIPKSAFFKHDFASFDGIEATANVYKCGDNLSDPHFISWAPITTPQPNFHCPEYFGVLKFE